MLLLLSVAYPIRHKFLACFREELSLILQHHLFKLHKIFTVWSPLHFTLLAQENSGLHERTSLYRGMCHAPVGVRSVRAHSTLVAVSISCYVYIKSHWFTELILAEKTLLQYYLVSVKSAYLLWTYCCYKWQIILCVSFKQRKYVL